MLGNWGLILFQIGVRDWNTDLNFRSGTVQEVCLAHAHAVSAVQDRGADPTAAVRVSVTATQHASWEDSAGHRSISKCQLSLRTLGLIELSYKVCCGD